MGKNFNIEIRKNCKICGKQLPNCRFRTFCSKKCRNKSYYIKNEKKNAEWTRRRDDKIASIPAKNKLQCQVCGKWYRKVGSHVWQKHKMSAREYREAYGFDVKKGQLPDDLKKLKADYAKENETMNNVIEGGKKYRFKKGQKGVGIYKRSQQTLERLKTLYKYSKNKKL